MEVFNIIVGVFSIIGSIAAIVGMSISINIKYHITNKGNNNSDNSQYITQQSRGKGNINMNKN